AGVLIKNAEALERMEKIDTLVIDKTGTLTEGKPKVVAVAPASGFEETQVLQLAASVERGSEHPLAAAIVAAAADRNLELSPVQGFDAPAGKGVTGMVDGKRLALGNAKFLAELGIDTLPPSPPKPSACWGPFRAVNSRGANAPSSRRRPVPRPSRWIRRMSCCRSRRPATGIRTSTCCRSSRTSSAAACRPASSRRCARSAASATASSPLHRPTRMPARSASMPPPRPNTGWN
ncbi:MAG: HAD family hydrolase, partial [Hyphomicrobiales bacterium]